MDKKMITNVALVAAGAIGLKVTQVIKNKKAKKAN